LTQLQFKNKNWATGTGRRIKTQTENSNRKLKAAFFALMGHYGKSIILLFKCTMG